jgi:hypothetical protein
MTSHQDFLDRRIRLITEIETWAEAFADARAAIRRAHEGGGEAILMNGRRLVVSTADALRLEVLGASFAYLGEHNGVVVAIPVNP